MTEAFNCKDQQHGSCIFFLKQHFMSRDAHEIHLNLVQRQASK